MSSGVMKAALIFMVLLLSAPLQAADLTIYTEEFPPYNFRADDGTIAGTSSDRVRQVMDRAGISYVIRLVPWSRAMRLATREENVLIYSLARTPAREPQFDWLVPLTHSQYYLFARADDAREVTLEALKTGQFRAVCVTTNISCEMLSRLGIPENKLTRLQNQGFRDLPMVLAGRADIYFNDGVGNAAQLREVGVEASAIRQAMAVEYDGGFYLAAGKQVPEAVRQKIRAAYEALVDEKAFSPADKPKPCKRTAPSEELTPAPKR